MWVFTRDGFFSAVQDGYCKENEIMVRARAKDDIECLAFKLRILKSKVIETGYADYLYRLKVRKEVFANYLNAEALNIDYDNFKNTISKKDGLRRSAYMRCWAALLDWQESLLYKFKKPKGKYYGL
jgi:hypothetical protein